MPFGLSAGALAAIGAGVSAAGTVAGSIVSSNASHDASKAAAQQQDKALQAQQAQQNAINTRTDPFVGMGYADIAPLQNFWSSYAQPQMQQAYANVQNAVPQAPGPMDQKALEATPGYLFSLNAGLRAVQNSAAAKGLGVSSNALNGAAKFATGLADSTYQNQFANQQALFGNRQTQYADAANNANLLTNQLNAGYGYLSGPVTLGANTAVGTGTQNVALTGQTSNAYTNLGNAQAAGITGGASPYSNALTGLGGDVAGGLGLYKYLSGTNSGGGNNADALAYAAATSPEATGGGGYYGPAF